MFLCAFESVNRVLRGKLGVCYTIGAPPSSCIAQFVFYTFCIVGSVEWLSCCLDAQLFRRHTELLSMKMSGVIYVN